MKKLKTSYSSDGKPATIHLNRGTETDPMWATLPFDSTTKTFIPQTELDQQLLRETQQLGEWKTLDLSDRPPELTPPPLPDWNKFRTSILGDIAYNRMRMATLGTPAELAGTRLENIAMAAPDNWEIIAGQWSILLGYTIAQKKPTASEVAQWNMSADDANMPFTFDRDTGAIVLSDNRVIEPIETNPVITQMAQNLDAYIADSGKKSQIVQEKTALKIDGLHPDSFSEFSWQIWDANESRIRPIKAGGKYMARVTLSANCLIPTVIQLELEAGIVVIPANPLQPFAAGKTNNSVTLNFFIRESFIATGLRLNVSASADVEINNAALYIVRLAG
jgi:hypothetical protein